MTSLPDIEGLITRIYDAALNDDLWSQILVDLADFSGADGAHLFIIDGATGNSPWGVIGRADPQAHREYVGEYAVLDKRLPRFLQYPNHRAWTTQSLLSPDEIKACPVHNEFLRKHGVFHLMGSTIAGLPGGSLIHAALRHENKGRFHREEIERWLMLLPHIERSVNMLSRFREMDALRSSLLDAIDKLNIGVILLDCFGTVLTVNQYASHVFRGNDGLTSRKGELLAGVDDERKRLHALIGTTGIFTHGGEASPGGSMRVSRPSGKKSYAVTVCPLPERRQGWNQPGAATIVFVNDPERSCDPPAARIAALFGLTPAEARLAAALAGGQTLSEYAECAGIAVSTVRSVLKNVLSKTETRRQAELVRRILTEATREHTEELDRE